MGILTEVIVVVDRIVAVDCSGLLDVKGQLAMASRAGKCGSKINIHKTETNPLETVKGGPVAPLPRDGVDPFLSEKVSTNSVPGARSRIPGWFRILLQIWGVFEVQKRKSRYQ